LSIDCVFDMLDFYQWKYSEECWSYFSQLLFASIPE